MKGSLRGSIAAALMATGFAVAGPGLATAMAAVGPAVPQRAVSAPKTRRESRTRNPLGGLRAGKRGPGWTVAQVKRMARKARNQARNRRAHRG